MERLKFDIVDAQYVCDHMDSMPLVDVRPHEAYEQGHIPGAQNVPLAEVLEKSDNYADIAAPMLVEAFEALGIMPGDNVIVYCQTGHHAAIACTFLCSMDYSEVHCYKGSWLDWTADTAHPIEK